MTQPEWELLRKAIDQLPDDRRAGVLERAGFLSGAQRPIECPLLDRASGQCMVYDVRPIACRTYGFYRERDNGLYCGMISDRVDSGEFDDVVWGNHAAVTSAQQALGPEHDLLYWMK